MADLAVVRMVPLLPLVMACTSSAASSDVAIDNSARRVEVEAQARGDAVNPRLLRRFKPLRAELVDAGSPAEPQIALGRMLFFDTRLSRDHDLSCNSCHQLEKYGVDNAPTSVGRNAVHGNRNSPTVYQAARQFANFWDGRAATIEAQAQLPILNPIEMGMTSPAAVVARLAAVPGYVDAFHAAFPSDAKPLTYDNVGRAIGAFERKLVTPSRWDRYLGGDKSALSSKELTGLAIFADIGCITCHTGELVGGSMFQKVGVASPWPNQKDQGRFAITALDEDRMVFKVPTLRNIAKTAPYFHDGSVATLDVAVRLMARHQLGTELTDDEVASIVTWLGSLTGQLPEAYIKPPVLPPDLGAPAAH